MTPASGSRPVLRSAAAVVLLVLLGGALLLTPADDVLPALRASVSDVIDDPPVVARGEQLYVAHCQACHGDRDGDGGIPYAPRHTRTGHTWHHTDADLVQIIMTGPTPVDELNRRVRRIGDDVPRMPAFRGVLTEADAAAVLAYIKTLWAPEQRASQARHSRDLDAGWRRGR